MSDASLVESLISVASNQHQLLAAQTTAAARLFALDKELYPHDGCAITLSVLMQMAGFDIPDVFMAFDLVKELKNRGWGNFPIGQQARGDVGTTCGQAPHHGVDHVYLVLRPVNADEMVIADNQAQQPHFRFASGAGGKSPTTFFLRAS